MNSMKLTADGSRLLQFLSEFHTILGNATGASYWAGLANATTSAIHDLLWDSDDKFYYYREG
jgi:neutral trehalase